MKKRKTAILIGVGICLLALVMYPCARNAWDMHCLDVKAHCLGTIYRSIVDKVVEAEPLGQKYSWPQTLSEVLDEKAKVELMKSGVDWRRIQYSPVSDESPDTNVVVMSLESGEHIILIKKGGALFRGRKKHAEQSAPPNPHSPSAQGAGGR
jgi:hypothetical protein